MTLSWNCKISIPCRYFDSVFIILILFSLLAIISQIYNWCMEIMSWSPGDNGRPMKPVKPEHVYFTDGEVAEYTNGAF